jgi:hypothetical protein
MPPMATTSLTTSQDEEQEREQELEQEFELDVRISPVSVTPQAKCHVSYTSSRPCCVP